MEKVVWILAENKQKQVWKMSKVEINFSCKNCIYHDIKANEDYCRYHNQFVDMVVMLDCCPFAYSGN